VLPLPSRLMRMLGFELGLGFTSTIEIDENVRRFDVTMYYWVSHPVHVCYGTQKRVTHKGTLLDPMCLNVSELFQLSADSEGMSRRHESPFQTCSGYLSPAV